MWPEDKIRPPISAVEILHEGFAAAILGASAIFVGIVLYHNGVRGTLCWLHHMLIRLACGGP